MTKLWRYVLALALLAVAFATRGPFLGRQLWNLDEGSTFTMAQIVREGGVLYRDAADNRTPLVPYLKAAIFAVAGDWNATAVHVVIALALGGAAIGLWQLCRRLGDERTGISAALLFVLYSFTLIGVHESQAAHTEWFQIFFSVPAFLVFAGAISRPSFVRGLGIGALFGAAALCKQPGLLDLGVTLVIAGLLAWSARGEARRGCFALVAGELTGLAVVFAATFAYFAANGALGDFVQYAWTYNTKFYVKEVPLLERWSYGRLSFKYALELSPGLLALAVGGAAVLVWKALASLRSTARAEKPVPVLTWLILGWSASGIASTMLSGRSFSHYVIGAIPGLSLATGWAVARLFDWARSHRWIARTTVALVFAGSLAFAVVKTAGELSLIRTTDDFPEDDAAAIQQLSGPQDRIFVWGYLPEIHFENRRLPNTRFVYSVFLTGMIPWTNLDPLIDTSYAIVPGSWERFWSDFRRTPPRLIVDTEGQRGWGKYPLNEQRELWAEIQRHYIRVERADGRALGYRYYLREQTAGTAATNAAVGDSVTPPEPLKLEFSLSDGATTYGELAFTAPADTTAIRVEPTDSPARSVTLPVLKSLGKTLRYGLAFGTAELRGTARVEVRTAAGKQLRGEIDLGGEFRRLRVARRAGPTLNFGGRSFTPLEATALTGAFRLLENQTQWLAHAPSRLVYERPPALTQLILEYGIDRGAWADRSHEPTSGADIVVEFEPNGEKPQRLFVRRLHPYGVAGDQTVQRDVVNVPGHAPGRLILRFLPGPSFDASFDWTYWQNVSGAADGPVIAYGADFLAPREQSAGSGKMTRLTDARWLSHAPARIVYDIPAGLCELRFGFGLIDESFAEGQPGKTDGITARVVGQRADGTSETLFERFIDPAKVATDRGPQRAIVAVPPRGFRSLVLTLDPGPKNNSAFDWSYLENFSAIAFGPSLELGDGRFLAAESSEQNHDGPLIVDGVHGTYSAHAPSDVTYRIPADLAAVTFEYGLFEGSYFDERGAPRTDGIEAVVEIIAADGRVTELFRRELTPVTRPGDRGRQQSRVAIPPGTPGKLRFRITPGPSGSNAFDWAYFINFRGELAP